MKNQFKHSQRILTSLTMSFALLVSAPLIAQESTSEQAVKIQQQSTINLNKSSAAQLATLKGIGNARAQAIILYRQEVGQFKSVDELTQVSGIGESIVKDNKARLSI